MPNNYFDHLVKKVGNVQELFYCKDADARTSIGEIETAISGMESELDGLWNVGESPVLYVSKINSRFNTINDAVDYASQYATTSNRVTIIISSGFYQEYIDLDNNPGIDFFGLHGVTIRSSVAWRLSTLRCSNTIRVANIDFENYYTPGDDEHAGYALHADPVTGFQKYYNCTFYSDNNAAIGIGLGANGQANFYNCVFRGSPGGIYAHNNATNGTQGQWLRFYNCIIEDHNNGNCIRIDDAASMAVSTNVSVMGMVFVGCTGNNNGITYRFNNPVETLSYIPAASSYNVFLYSESANNSIIGLDPILQKQSIMLQFANYGDNYYRIPFKDAYKYEWTLTSIKYKDYSSGWGTYSTFTGTYIIKILADQPDAILVYVPGTASLPCGYRMFDVRMTGVPRKTLTLDYVIVNHS